MPTLTLKLNAKTTKAEDDEALHLMVAALTNDSDGIERRFKRAPIKKMLKSGTLKLHSERRD